MDSLSNIKVMLRDDAFKKDILLKHIPNTRLPLIPIIYFQDGKILRSRANENVESFSNILDLTYPPVQYAKLNRLSAKGEPMFYGSLFSKSSNTNNCLPRIVNILETFDSFRHTNKDGSIMTTVGNWSANRNLTLLAFPLASYSRSFVESEEIRKQYNKIKSNYSKEKRDFAKYVGYLLSQERRSCLYEITSAIAHYVLYDNSLTNSFDGILYPSVQTAGEGLNVCLKPDVVDDALVFQSARKQELVKRGKDVTILDILDAEADDEGRLSWGPVIKNLR